MPASSCSSSLSSDLQSRFALLPLESLRGFAVVLSAMADHCGVVDHFLAAGYAALAAPVPLGYKPWAERSEALLATLTAS